MKYIFMAGAPGSKWSSVSKNIYYSPSIDRSDYKDEWTYYHDAPGTMQLMHMGAYFDPGMECDLPADLSTLSKQQLEERFDAPFSGEGVRIIKSHIFANNIDYLKGLWPEVPIVLVYRSDDACLGWWVKCGHFNITYPKYDQYYVDLREMANKIREQNAGIVKAWTDYEGTDVYSNHRLALNLGLAAPPKEYIQNYQENDIQIKVINF